MVAIPEPSILVPKCVSYKFNRRGRVGQEDNIEVIGAGVEEAEYPQPRVVDAAG